MNCMNILFYGFRHGHIYTLYRTAKARSDVRIVACVEENEEAREKAAKELGVEFDQRDFAQLLQEDIDAVAIGGRYGDRGAAIIQALKAGKHVIADKPICTSLEELEEIQDVNINGEVINLKNLIYKIDSLERNLNELILKIKTKPSVSQSGYRGLFHRCIN